MSTTKRFCGIRCTFKQYNAINDFYRANDFPNQSSLILTALLSYANNGNSTNNGNTDNSPKENKGEISKPQVKISNPKPKKIKWFEKDFTEFKDRVIRLEDQIAQLL